MPQKKRSIFPRVVIAKVRVIAEIEKLGQFAGKDRHHMQPHAESLEHLSNHAWIVSWACAQLRPGWQPLAGALATTRYSKRNGRTVYMRLSSRKWRISRIVKNLHVHMQCMKKTLAPRHSD